LKSSKAPVPKTPDRDPDPHGLSGSMRIVKEIVKAGDDFDKWESKTEPWNRDEWAAEKFEEILGKAREVYKKFGGGNNGEI